MEFNLCLFQNILKIEEMRELHTIKEDGGKTFIEKRVFGT